MSSLVKKHYPKTERAFHADKENGMNHQKVKAKME